MIGQGWKWTVATGEPVGLIYRRRGGDGAFRPLDGEVLVLTLFAPTREPRGSSVGELQQDAEGDLVRVMLPPGTSEALWGERSLSWELARLLPGGDRRRLFGGAFEVTASAAYVAGAAPIAGEPDLEELIEGEGSSAREVVNRGAPGIGYLEAAGTTLPEEQARLGGIAADAGEAAVQPSIDAVSAAIAGLGDALEAVLPSQRTASSTTFAVANDHILADTSAGSFVLTLPADGGRVTIDDAAATWGTNPLAIAGNGRTIDGAATFNANAPGFRLAFISVGSVWRYALTPLYGA